MKTLVSAAICCHSRIRVSTKETAEFIDVTHRIQALAVEAEIHVGLVNIQCLHTTTAIVVNQHEPLLFADFGSTLARVAPKDAPYHHNDPNAWNLPDVRPNNSHAHCQSLLLASSASLNVADGRLQLGRWQRVFFVELDGPREREMSVLFVGEGVR